ncbi:NADPH-dependent FMN reductase [Caldimonas sp. KR1-144]|uniref:NADPH-dependent FMN reductase n=1 Tax=Caldimonas sp. KR1-144 TaxID=3400911 RepID=UPI003C0DEDA1
MSDLKVLVIAGSARRGAYSVQLAQAAAELLRAAGAQTTMLDLRALALPIYDGDIEADHGVPAGAATLRDALRSHDALLLVTPEYNGFPTPLVINAFDWLSRLKAEGEAPAGLAVTASKPAALLSSSPGPLGGLRSLNYLRQYLSMAFAMLVVPQQFALGRAAEAFDEHGGLKDEKTRAAVQGVLASLLKVAGAMKGAR